MMSLATTVHVGSSRHCSSLQLRHKTCVQADVELAREAGASDVPAAAALLIRCRR